MTSAVDGNVYEPVLVESRIGNLRIWDHPIGDAKYVIGIDTAEGKVRDRGPTTRRSLTGIYSDDRPDYSAAVVLSLDSCVHVATWHGHIETTEFSVVCAALGYYYNRALLIPELNGPGLVIVENLAKVVRYPNLYRTKVWNVVDGEPLGNSLGWRTTEESRRLLIGKVEELVNSRKLRTRDALLLKELRTMQIDEQGRARARNKDKDDLVMALGLALQGRFEMLYGTLQQKPSFTKTYRSKLEMTKEKWLQRALQPRGRPRHPLFDLRSVPRGGPDRRVPRPGQADQGHF